MDTGELLKLYCKLDYHLIPLHHVTDGRCSCGKPDCVKNAGKHPCVGKEWEQKASADMDDVLRWHTRWPKCNWGVLTGPKSNVLMVGPDGEQGHEDLARLVQQHGELPDGPIQWSGTSPGYHLVYTWPEDGLDLTNRKDHQGTRIDVRGENGQFVVEPSRNVNGCYRWGKPPWAVRTTPAPDWLLSWIRADARGERPKCASGTSSRKRVWSGNAMRRRALAYLEKVPGAISGQGGHPATFWAARVLVRGFDIPPDEALRILMDEFNSRCSPPWTEEELRHKVLQAEVIAFDKPRGWLLDTAREAPDDPHRLARLYAGCCTEQQQPLLWHRDEWFRWSAGSYRRVEEKEIGAELTRSVKREFDRLAEAQHDTWLASGGTDKDGKEAPSPVARKVSGGLVCDTRGALASELLVPGTVSPPAWLDSRAEPDPSGLVVCRNGIVNLADWADGRPYLSPLTPELFTTVALPFDLDQRTPAPSLWLWFLGELWGDDAQSIGLLQEWFGYCLTPDTSQHKILLVVGPRRSGKGTIGRVLTQLVGPANVCTPTLASLGLPFGLQPLLGKTLAVISDARLSDRSDVAVVTERLLSISGEDGQTVDRKHKTAVHERLPVRFVVSTNELPRLNDTSAAVAGRMLALRLTRSWLGNEDTKLTSKLLVDLPGILLWAMEGWRRLRDRGRFDQPRAAAPLLQQLEDLSSPVAVFIRECCDVAPEFQVARPDLYNRYRLWCISAGLPPASREEFGRDLRARIPCLESRQITVASGQRVRIYRGLRLSQPGQATSPTPSSPPDDEGDEEV